MKCVIECLDGRHKPILLPHKTPLTLGRSDQTLIQDSKVSRQQVELSADYTSQTLLVKQLGTRPSQVDGETIMKGASSKTRNGAVIHLLHGKYPYRVRFISKTDNSTDEASSKTSKNSSKTTDVHSSKGVKRVADSPSESDRKKRRSESGDDGCSEDEDGAVAAQLEMMRKQAKQLSASPRSGASHHSDSAADSPSASDQPVPEIVATDLASADSWFSHGKLLLFTSTGTRSSSKIAGFDIDSTIITTASGKRFPTHAGDWTIMLSEIPGKLKKIHAAGYKVVFFTNQMGIARGKVKVEEYKQKVENIVKKLGVPVQVFVSTGPGEFRKPGPGMWDRLCDHCNGGIKVDKKHSYYVGDAAGRPDKWAPGRKKDFACSDRLFALNVGIEFHTPEEYFLGYKKAAFNMPDFDPRKLNYNEHVDIPTPKGSEVIVCVGFPASGKSFFCKSHLVPKGYVHVNRDTLGTWQKCVAKCQQAVAEKKCVVVDNTNPDPEARQRYINVAKKAGIKCRCFYFTTSFAHCRHNERFREFTDKSHQPINDMIMHTFKNKFKVPEQSEGFSELKKVEIVPQFTDKSLERLYRCFLMEK